MQRLTLGVLVPLALLLATGQTGLAADLTITKPWASVRARPEAQAPAVALVFGNDALSVLRQAPGWVQVRLPGGRSGWIDRAHGALDLPPLAPVKAAPPALAALPAPTATTLPPVDWDVAPGGT